MAESSAAGWFGGLRRRLDSVVGVAETRLQLLALEVQEEKLRLARLLFMTVLAAIGVGMAAVFAAIWLTVLLWDSHRLLVLGLSTAAFLLAGVAAATAAARTMAQGSALFAASLAELAKDRAALRPRDRDAP